MAGTGRRRAEAVSEMASFREEYAMLDDAERAAVDALVGALRRRLAAPGEGEGPRIVAFDDWRRTRTLHAACDDILTVTDGRVAVDVLRRADGLLLLGASGRLETALPVEDGPMALAG